MTILLLIIALLRKTSIGSWLQLSPRTFFRWLVVATVIASTAGCLGYKIGTKAIYRQDIRTVHIPVIRSESFRPELGVMLTEALQKEVERRTSYKITNAETADSVLTCRLTGDAKRVVGETRQDDPRIIESVMKVELSWTDRRGLVLIETRFLPPGEIAYYFSDHSNFIPEAGQSMATANMRVVERLANHIVDQMEARW